VPHEPLSSHGDRRTVSLNLAPEPTRGLPLIPAVTTIAGLSFGIGFAMLMISVVQGAGIRLICREFPPAPCLTWWLAPALSRHETSGAQRRLARDLVHNCQASPAPGAEPRAPSLGVGYARPGGVPSDARLTRGQWCTCLHLSPCQGCATQPHRPWLRDAGETMGRVRTGARIMPPHKTSTGCGRAIFGCSPFFLPASWIQSGR
jgi:hypothetical protein